MGAGHIDYLEKEMINNEEERNNKLISNINKLKDLNEKQETLMRSYINNKISQDLLEKMNFQIEDEIKTIWNENKFLKNHEKWLEINKRLVELFKYVVFVLDMLKKEKFSKKSSQSFSMLFHIVANCFLGSKKVLSYQLKAPFNLFKNVEFGLWFGIRDSNPWCQIQSLEPYRLANSEYITFAILLKILYNQVNYIIFLYLWMKRCFLKLLFLENI